jgi:hypothetical protein
MGQRLQIGWPRMFVEGAAIVVSILLAFWIDAWWDTAQDRDREVIVLGALLDDLQYMRWQVDDQRRYNEGILDAVVTLLRAGTSGERLDPAKVDALLASVVWYNPSGIWESATMNLLVSAGGLAQLTDVGLVHDLAALHNRLKRARDRYELDESFYRDRLIPFLGREASLPQILAGIDHAPGVPEWVYDFPALQLEERVDHTALLSNSEFLGLLAAKVDIQHDIINYSLSGIDKDLDDVIDMLRLNLGVEPLREPGN